MAVVLGRTDAGALSKVGTSQVFGKGFRNVIVGSVDAAGDIADIWDKNKGGLSNVECIIFDRPGLTPDYAAKTVAAAAGAVFPQRFVAFGH